MKSQVEQRVREILADLLRTSAKEINEGTGFDRTPGWDSTNHVNLVVALEEEFGISLDVPEIERMVTFRAVVQTVEAKL